MGAQTFRNLSNSIKYIPTMPGNRLVIVPYRSVVVGSRQKYLLSPGVTKYGFGVIVSVCVRVWYQIWSMSPNVSELISKLRHFFLTRFFLEQSSIHVVTRKNCPGHQECLQKLELEPCTFSLHIFPRAGLDLLGAGDLHLGI